jgi:hypothetical protein
VGVTDMLTRFLKWLDWRGVSPRDFIMVSLAFGALFGLVVCGLIAIAGGG